MGDDEHNDDGDKWISSHDCYMDCGYDSKEEWQWVMGVGIGGCGIGDHVDLEDKRVQKDATGNNRGICIRDTNI